MLEAAFQNIVCKLVFLFILCDGYRGAVTWGNYSKHGVNVTLDLHSQLIFLLHRYLAGVITNSQVMKIFIVFLHPYLSSNFMGSLSLKTNQHYFCSVTFACSSTYQRWINAHPLQLDCERKWGARVLFSRNLRLLRLFVFFWILSDYISMIALKLYKASHSALSSLAGWTDDFSTTEPLSWAL